MMAGLKRRAATDVGGTFTDLAWCDVDPQTGRCSEVRVAKVDTTPPDFDRGVLHTLEKADVDPQALDFFAHGSTVVINALTERKGVKTGLITTEGFRDVIEIARGNRPDLFNFNFRKPPPIVDRNLRAELPERANYRGEITRPVDLGGLDGILRHFRDEGVEAIAIVFLHAYLAPENEIRAKQAVQEAWPEVSVLASHEVSREWREYERTSTTALSAYVHPIAKRYIERLEHTLRDRGFRGRLYMMQSNGGILSDTAAKQNPVAMVESGPASGVYAAAWLGRAIGERNLIVLDIGGTTAKCALVENGEVRISTRYYIEKTPQSPGYPIQTPVTEIVEIGNGGGSIAWIDDGGKLHVGPQSAGAVPGPAAYGRGGEQATTTDANLLLGRIDPESFVGGEVKPDWKAVEHAFLPLAGHFDIPVKSAARGVLRIANANMINALRLVSTNKGHDPRDFALIAFGGGGAMHAVDLARELKVRKVIVPVNSAVFSAWGMLVTDLRRDYLQTNLTELAPEARDEIGKTFVDMQRQARVDFAADDKEQVTDLVFGHFADMRYLGQEHTVKVELQLDDGQIDIDAVLEAFHAAHEQHYTYRLDTPVEIVNFHLVATACVDKPELAKKPVTGASLEDALLGHRTVDFDQAGEAEAAIYDGLALEPGMSLDGPAVVQEPSVTLVVPPGLAVQMDEFGNYHIDMHPGE